MIVKVKRLRPAVVLCDPHELVWVHLRIIITLPIVFSVVIQLCADIRVVYCTHAFQSPARGAEFRSSGVPLIVKPLASNAGRLKGVVNHVESLKPQLLVVSFNFLISGHAVVTDLVGLVRPFFQTADAHTVHERLLLVISNAKHNFFSVKFV